MVMKIMNKLTILCAAIAFNVNAQDFGTWSVDMGRTMTMNSAICNQTGTCNKYTPEQKTQRKAISDQAYQCISAAHRRYSGDSSNKEREVSRCKAVRDQQYYAIRGSARAASPANPASPNPVRSIDFAIANYQVSPTVTDEVRRRLRDGLSRVSNSQAQQQLVSQIDFESVFDSAMNKYGLRSGNMIDTMTGYWLTMWSIVHRTSMPNRSAIEGVRAQMAAIAKQSGIATVRSEDKQRESQKLIWQMVLALGAQRQPGMNLKDLSMEVNRTAVRQGMDLSLMMVTNEGFVRR
jgi:hypothetical protein